MNACRTPWKLPFATRAEAKTTARRMTAPLKGGQLRPYRCDCGKWHLTSMSRRLSRAIAKLTRNDR